MAQETIDYQDRIITDPEIMAGRPVVRGTRVPVKLVLGQLARNPDLEALYAAYPELTREDVQAVLAYAHDKVAEPCMFQSPQDFYREATQREDVRQILAELAK
jgi:uncharacterized protein (DUF433 family)